jgi:hypothetical protein
VKKFVLVFLLAVSAFAQGTKSLPSAAPDEKIDAAALIKEVLANAPKSHRQMMGLLKIRAEDGSHREVPLKWMVRLVGEEWHDIYQTPDKGSIPQQVLIVMHRQDATNRYEYQIEEKAVPNIATNLFSPFATSDFWLADLGLEFLHWPNPKHVKTEMRKHRPCYVIETVNPHPENGGYARVLSWIDTEYGGLIRAEGYTADKKLLKEFQLAGFTKVDGRWQVKAMTIRNDQTDTNTRLEFDLEIKD